MDEIDKVISGLTEAQRWRLEAICDNALADDRPCRPLHNLGHKGLVKLEGSWGSGDGLNNNGYYVATDLGLAVRARLQEQADG